MDTFKIIDNAFAHQIYRGNLLNSTDFSKYIKWDRRVSDNEDVVFYTDKSILIQNLKSGHKKKIAWLIEPYCKQPHKYEWILQNNKLFDYVLTFDEKLLNVGENFVFVPAGGAWILSENRKFHNKTKTVSIIASGKKNVPAHFLRHDLISIYKDKIDVYGRGYISIDPIDIGLVDYMFNISMENEQRNFDFTEKIFNPMLCGTIPIYYGMPSIGNFFDTRGMIIFNHISEIGNILENLTPELYKSMLPYAKENFLRCQEYILIEDWMYNNCFEQLELL